MHMCSTYITCVGRNLTQYFSTVRAHSRPWKSLLYLPKQNAQDLGVGKGWKYHQHMKKDFLKAARS